VATRRETLSRRIDGRWTLVCRECDKIESATRREPAKFAKASGPRHSNRVESWMSRGACREANQELFFGTKEQAQQVARQYCAVCPVIAECATYADLRYLEGLWGGEFRTSTGAGRGAYISEPVRTGNRRITTPVKVAS